MDGAGGRLTPTRVEELRRFLGDDGRTYEAFTGIPDEVRRERYYLFPERLWPELGAGVIFLVNPEEEPMIGDLLILRDGGEAVCGHWAEAFEEGGCVRLRFQPPAGGASWVCAAARVRILGVVEKVKWAGSD